MSVAALLLQLALCAAVIGVAGSWLCRSADALATAHGWGRGWIGLALLASVTSLPELSAGINAVARVGDAELAVGNALGACIVNLGFIGVVAALWRGGPLDAQASATHRLTAWCGAGMLGGVALGTLAGPAVPSLAHVGLLSPLLVAAYLLALRATFRQAPPDAGGTAAPEPATPPGDARRSARSGRPGWQFAAAALCVLAAGSWLPGLGHALAQAAGLGSGFVGTALLSLVTTLPEIVVTLAALRLGAPDMALGNLLGSTLFNLVVLAIDDLAYRPGPLLAAVGTGHAVTATMGMAMCALVLVGLALRPAPRQLFGAGWVGPSLGMSCVLALAVSAGASR